MKLLLLSAFLLAVNPLQREEKSLSSFRSEISPRGQADSCGLLMQVDTSSVAPVLSVLLGNELFPPTARRRLESDLGASARVAPLESLGGRKDCRGTGAFRTSRVRKDTESVAPRAALLLTGPERVAAGATTQALAQMSAFALAPATAGGLCTVESPAVTRLYEGAAGLNSKPDLVAIGGTRSIAASQPIRVAGAIEQAGGDSKPLADRVPTPPVQPPRNGTEAGFVPIFNGKDLTGWEGKPGWWKIEDGALTAESTSDKPCNEAHYLLWRGGQPGDFELWVDFKLSLKGNSGIQIRSEERPNWDTFGYQADMSGDGELIGFIYHHGRGLVAGRGESVVFGADGSKATERIGDPARLLQHFRQGDWNTYRMVCRDNDIALYLNGVLMCQVTDRSKRAAVRGILALQMHPGPPMKVQFKNIWLKEL